MPRTKMFNSRDYINAYNESVKAQEKDADRAKKKSMLEQQNILEANESIFNMKASRSAHFNKRMQFSENVKVALLSECINKVYSDAQGISIVSEGDDSIRRGLISSFIYENGVNDLLTKFATKSYLLSEFASLVNKYHKKIMESNCDKNCDTYAIDAEIKDDFFNDLNILDTGEASETIRMRVSDAIDQFIQDNINAKQDIEETLKTAKEKIDSSKLDEVKESYEHLAKRKITDIRSSRKQTIFGAMVSSMAESVIKNDDLKQEYMTEGKIDMDKIVDRTKLMYSFLETVNTLKMDNVNEEYIESVIKTMKE